MTEISEQTANVSIKMPASLVAELRAVAAENDRSLSYQARVALKEWLAEYAKRAA